MHEHLTDHRCHLKRYAIPPTTAEGLKTVMVNRSSGPVAITPHRPAVRFGPARKRPRSHSLVMPGRRSAAYRGRKLLFAVAGCEVLFRQDVRGGQRVLTIEDGVIDTRIQGATFSDARPGDVSSPPGTQE